MNVTAPEKKWTDHRLDDLAKKVHERVTQADKPLGEFRGEVNARFDKVDERFEKVEGKIEGGIKELRGETNARFEKVDGRFDRLDRKIDGLGYLLLTVALGYFATHAL
jgi:tetrahydromethanopterin S-methyltransferase subunit G